MRTFRLSKLVRNGVAPDLISQGGEVVSRKLAGAEKVHWLIGKIIEEAKEIDASNVAPEELGDLYEAADELRRTAGISLEAIAAARAAKNAKSGTFSDGTFIETVSLPDDNKWADYFASQPDKSPEVSSE